MLRPDEIIKRLGAIWKITFGGRNRLQELDISPAGFKASFLAIPVTLVPFLLNWFFIVQTPPSFMKDISQGELFLRLAFINLSQWIIPLMLVIALSGLLGIRDRVIPFVIAYNWMQAFLAWLTVPLIILPFLFPTAARLFWDLMQVLLIFYIFIAYRVLQAALDKTFSYMLPFFIIYIVINVIAALLANALFAGPLLTAMLAAIQKGG